MTSLFEPVTMIRGPQMKNRFVLAPMTNQQSHADGTVSEDESRWLAKRAEGQFGLVMTAAAHVQPSGQGFPGQIAAYDDCHVDGLRTLASTLRERGAVSSLQLYHGGLRSPPALVGKPLGPSSSEGGSVYGTGGAPLESDGFRGLTLDEIAGLRAAFVQAALRAERAGFDGVEIHGAHGYLLCAFLSPELNQRDDEYGGSLANRSRLMFEVVDDIRRACGPQFQLGLRLSTERYGMRLGEVKDVAAEFLREAKIDYLDLSLWDVNKRPAEPGYGDDSLLSHFVSLSRGDVRLGAAGKIMGGAGAAALLDAGCDFAVIGKAGIVRHDFPMRVQRDPLYKAPALPVSVAELEREAVSTAFLEFMRGNLAGFLREEESA
ncbi:NADH:flavin oxidoreductase [Novosphingobium sp. 9U]|uniref:NADH:flavin oxidoreductase n=1 Tax=Novosphingobium sp. 9U TaxID=2653158 RepID=UPI0012F0A5FE|nr:NADH:flavin oxidoreductase [Novosphingobium sp. 9U]VWX50585.1 NADH:flavin oxidoreductase [Novosphingobium sp. 9U]